MSSKTIGQRQQEAGRKTAGSPPLKQKRAPPKERGQTPSPAKVTKKSKTASPGKSASLAVASPGKSIGDLAAVDELEETSIESATNDAASVTEVHESSSDTPNPDAEKDVTELPASSHIRKQRGGKEEAAGKDAEGDNSDSSNKDEDTGDSDDDILPTPVKKQSGIERLQRGRQIKASSPAGITHPSRTSFDLLFDVVCFVVRFIT